MSNEDKKVIQSNTFSLFIFVSLAEGFGLQKSDPLGYNVLKNYLILIINDSNYN